MSTILLQQSTGVRKSHDYFLTCAELTAASCGFDLPFNPVFLTSVAGHFLREIGDLCSPERSACVTSCSLLFSYFAVVYPEPKWFRCLTDPEGDLPGDFGALRSTLMRFVGNEPAPRKTINQGFIVTSQFAYPTFLSRLWGCRTPPSISFVFTSFRELFRPPELAFMRCFVNE